MRKNNSNNQTVQNSKLESVLAWGAVICIGASVLAFLVVLIIGAIQSTREVPGGSYQAIAWIAYVGMPLGFLMLFTLLFMNLSKRKREQRR
ncbi:hypothetical protein [Canibacter oris]|uniref:ABC-type antimicrobial peptide transport system permease subunit n=1 Tax=Canibacter oris TaxID=1365628 RepID=A0A840DF20_9MICO|nr:hypothetical protein [Canibacter oris]MBB4072011.1 ABC-type antimicrobial peptide transport system permease subunit [Canibacter oris]